MKKIVVLAFAVLLACCSACAISQSYSQPMTTPATEAETPPITTVPATTFPLYADELTDTKRQAIIESVNKSGYFTVLEPSAKANCISDKPLVYYLGTYNGYDIIVEVGNAMFEAMAIKEGNEFWGNPNSYGATFTHYQGVVDFLAQSYRIDKVISDEDLHTAAQKWFDIVCQLCGEDEARNFYADYGFADRYE